jgi:hypothetical protein
MTNRYGPGFFQALARRAAPPNSNVPSMAVKR